MHIQLWRRYVGTISELFHFKPSAKPLLAALALLIEANLSVHVVNTVQSAGLVLQAAEGIEVATE